LGEKVLKDPSNTYKKFLANRFDKYQNPKQKAALKVKMKKKLEEEKRN